MEDQVAEGLDVQQPEQEGREEAERQGGEQVNLVGSAGQKCGGSGQRAQSQRRGRQTDGAGAERQEGYLVSWQPPDQGIGDVLQTFEEDERAPERQGYIPGEEAAHRCAEGDGAEALEPCR